MRVVLIPLIIAAVCVSGRCDEPAATQPAATETSPQQKRVTAATAVLDSLSKKLQIVQMTPEFVELYIDALKNLCDAKLALAKTRDERIAIATQYLNDAKTLRKRAEERKHIDTETMQWAQCDYAVADAEIVLEKEKAAEKK